MSITLPALAAITAMQASTPVKISTADIDIMFKPRSPDQMAAFYEARGFPEPMIESVRKVCFITVGITNKSNQRIWLNVDHWEFKSGDKTLERISKKQWKQRWQDMEIPMQYQSTFRWTMINEALGYFPGEREGGNITLPKTKGPISLTAHFYTGEDRSGPVITVSTDRLYCAEDKAQ
jgi:hypothetical protein